jgi:GWxTD domain-containing protein
MKKILIFIAVLFIFISLATSICISNQIQPKEDFLSLVRYIILNEEVNMYKEYPPSEREEFVEQFWERRDPNPKTFKNEFKEEYFRRIKTANELFKGGIAGWLQERGRIFLLFGPPDEREIHPLGIGPSGKPMEKWTYYKFFNTSFAAVIYFVDINSTGNFKISTSRQQENPDYPDFAIYPNITYIHEINKQESLARQSYLKKPIFNLKWNFIKKRKKGKNKELQINIEIPYERVIFRLHKDQLIAAMELFIEIRDINQEFVWDFNKTYSVSFPYSKFDSKKNSLYFFKIPLTPGFQKGEYSIYIHLTNLSGNQDVKKLLQLKM